MAFHRVAGLHTEVVDDGYMVLVAGADRVLHLQGDDAGAFALAACDPTVVPERLHISMAGLVELGVVVSDTWSRRRILQLGGVAAAAAVAVVTLPGVAAAESHNDGDPSTSTTTSTLPPQRGTDLYIADWNLGAVYKVTRDGIQSTVASGLSLVNNVAVALTGHVYAAMTGKVVVIAPGGTVSDFLTGLNQPLGLAVGTDGTVFVTEKGMSRLLAVPPGGGSPTVVDTGPLDRPNCVALDAAGNFYIADEFNQRVVKVPAGGGSQSVFASGLTRPWGVTVDGDGYVYVAGQLGGVVKKYSPGGGTASNVGSGLGAMAFALPSTMTATCTSETPSTSACGSSSRAAARPTSVPVSSTPRGSPSVDPRQGGRRSTRSGRRLLGAPTGHFVPAARYRTSVRGSAMNGAHGRVPVVGVAGPPMLRRFPAPVGAPSAVARADMSHGNR